MNESIRVYAIRQVLSKYVASNPNTRFKIYIS